MYGDSQRKGVSRWNIGPDTEPQLKQMYHGLGEAPIYLYTGNPVSWLVSLTQCIPFLNLKSGEQDQPQDQAVADDLLDQIQGNQEPLDTAGGGGFFTSDPLGQSYLMPHAFNAPPEIQGFAASGTPMGTIHGKMVPLRASRRTYSGG